MDSYTERFSGPQKEGAVDNSIRALKETDLDKLAAAATAAGLLYVRAKMEAASLETGRAVFRLEIRDKMIEQGQNKTSAEDTSRTHPDYLNYCAGLQSAEAERDYAEVIYKGLRDRLYALRGWVVAQ